MLTTFEEIIERLLRHEGGYVNNPKDKGGETKYGISKRVYPDVNIKNLSKEQAIEIYRKDYWARCKAEQLPAALRYIHFDTAVNSGIGRAAKILQASIGGISVDGIIGKKTLGNIGKTNVYKYALYRLRFYNELVAKNHSQVIFLRGWTNRVLDIVSSY